MKTILISLVFLFFQSMVFSASLKDAHRKYFSGHPKDALTIYKSLLNSSHPKSAALNAFIVAQELGRHKEAINILRSTNKKLPNDQDISAQLAWALLNEGHFDEADHFFEAAVGTDSLNPIDLIGHAQIYLENKEYLQARNLLEFVNKQRPRLTLVPFFLGKGYVAEGRSMEAIESFKKTIAMDSHFVESRLYLADLYEKTNDPNNAWRQYVKTSYAHSGNPIAARGMKRIKNKITQKPEKIIPPKTIENPSQIPAMTSPETLEKIRIGIGTSSAGKPTRKNWVLFRTGGPFRIVNQKTKRVLATGKRNLIWQIKLSNRGKRGRIYNSTGGYVTSFKGSILIDQPGVVSPTIIINSLKYAEGTPWGGMADKEMRGELEVRVHTRSKRLITINHVTVEEYVYGVLAAEMPVHWPLEALKSQAVIARNIAVYRKRLYRTHRKYGYDLCDEQHCQVYAGVRVESDKARQAVDETRGELLWYRGKPAHTVFSSNCGGMTQNGVQAGWGHINYWKSISDAKPNTSLPTSPWELKKYLQTEPDLYCQSSPHIWYPEYRWARVVEAKHIANKLRRKRNLGRVRQIYILKRNKSGRVQKIQVIGTKGFITLTKEHHIRRYLGLGSQRSTQFMIETVVREGKAHSFVFYGGGWGHGVGLCQSGAAGRADAGMDYKEILVTYYEGTELRR